MNMNWQTVGAVLVLMLTFAMCRVQAAPRGNEGGRAEGGNAGARKPERSLLGQQAGGRGLSAPGGDWSERSHHSGVSASNASQGSAATRSKGVAGNSNSLRTKQTTTNTGAAGQPAAKRGSSSVTPGQAAGAAAVKRNSPQSSGVPGVAGDSNNSSTAEAAGGHRDAAGAAAVRHSYNNHGLYSRNWYDAHPGVWAPVGWAAGAAWTPTTWGAVSSYCGATAIPVAYNYGTNVTCQDGNVMVDGQNVGTPAEFSQQAAELAQAGAATETTNADEWLPLGVFAMVRNEQQHPQLILQLAISKAGILRGNYTDELSEHTQPIQGAVDRKTQRATWTVGDNTTSVMEAGLNNLTQGEAPALIHKNGKTDHWLLVRLEQPGKDPAGAPVPAQQE